MKRLFEETLDGGLSFINHYSSLYVHANYGMKATRELVIFSIIISLRILIMVHIASRE